MTKHSVNPPGTNLPELGAAEIARRLAAGELSSSEVTAACIARIEQVNPTLQAVSQPLLSEALQEAEQADRLLSTCRARDETPPLLCGVPMTVKDCFDVAGTATTLGIPSRVDEKSARDSPLVSRLRGAGAVILGKTNVPQAMLLHCCDNPAHGRTLHPLDDQRGPGGSSGGEAAIVAAGGSPLGLGSDLGGSIRQPAHACGLAGLKPTTGRLTNVGSHRSLVGMEAISIQSGPLARRTDDLDLAMRALCDTTYAPQQPDEQVRPWRDYRQVYVNDLTIAYWTSDGWFESAPAIAGAVEDAAAALRELGANVKPIVPIQTGEAMRVYFGLVSADGLRSVRRTLRGGAIDWQVRRQTWFAAAPGWLRPMLGGALRSAGQRQLARLLSLSGPRSADAYWRLTTEANLFRNTFWASIDEQFGRPVDAVICPPHGLPALRHNTALDLLPAGSYCYLPNLLGAPAGVAPWTTVQTGEEGYPHGRRWDLVDHLARRTMAGSAGLPIGVQVMARDWREDIVLAVMAALEHGRC